MKKRNQIIPAFLVFFVLILAPILAHTVVKFGHDLAPRNSLDRIAPDASVLFPDADIQVTDKAEGDAYQFVIREGTSDMYQEYVDCCKRGEFTDVNCDIDSNFQAYTKDKNFWISVTHYPGTRPAEQYVYVDIRDLRGDEKQ